MNWIYRAFCARVKWKGMKVISMILAALFAGTLFTRASEIEVRTHRIPNDDATAAFQIPDFTSPSVNDAAAGSKVRVVAGQVDGNSAGPACLTDGKLPGSEDEPRANFFFAAGTDGGRVLLDLGRVVAIREINTWSWHAGSRAPQVYAVYAGSDTGTQLDLNPGKGTDLAGGGWARIAEVDTRPKADGTGGQYAVSIRRAGGEVGSYRYLLFDVRRSEGDSPFGNTFFSEIDVIDAESAGPLQAIQGLDASRVFTAGEGRYEIRVDTSAAPDLRDWAVGTMAPMAVEWYPRLAEMLGSKDYEAPRKVTIYFLSDPDGVAATGGTRVGCSAEWFRANLKGEALGAVFHELAHVVQQYGQARRRSGGGERGPGWLVEGIADYARWFRFEPESRGAEITRRNLDRARYDASYRFTANFLDWASRTYADRLVPELNAAIREGRYKKSLWKTLTGHELEQLGSEWRAMVEEQVTNQKKPAETSAVGKPD